MGLSATWWEKLPSQSAGAGENRPYQPPVLCKTSVPTLVLFLHLLVFSPTPDS